jgi:uncharacterized protein (DUF1015 family)
MTVAHAIDRAWLSAGGTGAQNYDEFADDAEITAVIEANPDSALAVEMPHRAPESLGASLHDALPAAAARLRAAKEQGRYRRHDRIIALYRIGPPPGDQANGQPGDQASGASGGTSYGVWTMVETGQISTGAGEPGLVIRNEDVFLEKVRERVALASATGHLLSPVLLLQTGCGDALHEALARATRRAGAPAVVDTDQCGRAHEVWPLGPGPEQDEILALAGGGELVVADGNHRSLAAQVAGLPRFLAVVTTPASVTIQPYNRLVGDSTLPPGELLDGLVRAGATVRRAAAGESPVRGTVLVYTRSGGYAVTVPQDADARPVENLDHAWVERALLRGTLGLDAGDKRITYVGGDYPPGWLTGEVDAGRAELTVLIAPVAVEDFVAVNLARMKLPRKSTWFTPKARAGLVVAELDPAGRDLT